MSSDILSPEDLLLLEEARRTAFTRATKNATPTEILQSLSSTPDKDPLNPLNVDRLTPVKENPPQTPVSSLSGAPALVINPARASSNKYFTLAKAFPNAAAFLMFFDSSLRSGNKTLYPWQIEELLRLSDVSAWKIDHKLQYYLLANNGSGKDAFIIAGLVVYVLCCVERYKVIITSSSDNQLDTQTRVYIADLSRSVNEYMRKEWGWKTDAIRIKAESFKSTPGFTGTEVYTFVSKEGGKVEGYHPFPDAPNKEGVIVIINEGKSIPEEIHRHLKKCTYNIWIEVSSAGESSGDFYKACENAIKYPAQPEAFRPFCRTITYKDTPHKQREAEAEIEELGIDHPFVKNTYLSKFSSIGQQVAITEENLDKCLKQCVQHIKLGIGKHAGLDFAAGGDECSFYVFDDNVCIGYESWRVKDTEITKDLLIGRDALDSGFFQKYGFSKDIAFRITGDDNGLGEPIINALHRQGWTISRVKNQQSARRKDRYLNRGAELYGTFARLIENSFINWNGKMHSKLRRQLITRHYTIEGQGKYKLVPKEDESESPDHADAAVLAFNGISIQDFLDKDAVKVTSARTPGPLIATADLVKIDSDNYRRWQFAKAIASQGSTDKGKFTSRFRNPITLMRSLYS